MDRRRRARSTTPFLRPTMGRPSSSTPLHAPSSNATDAPSFRSARRWGGREQRDADVPHAPQDPGDVRRRQGDGEIGGRGGPGRLDPQEPYRPDRALPRRTDHRLVGRHVEHRRQDVQDRLAVRRHDTRPDDIAPGVGHDVVQGLVRMGHNPVERLAGLVREVVGRTGRDPWALHGRAVDDGPGPRPVAVPLHDVTSDGPVRLARCQAEASEVRVDGDRPTPATSAPQQGEGHPAPGGCGPVAPAESSRAFVEDVVRGDVDTRPHGRRQEAGQEGSEILVVQRRQGGTFPDGPEGPCRPAVVRRAVGRPGRPYEGGVPAGDVAHDVRRPPGRPPLERSDDVRRVDGVGEPTQHGRDAHPVHAASAAPGSVGREHDPRPRGAPQPAGEDNGDPSADRGERERGGHEVRQRGHVQGPVVPLPARPTVVGERAERTDRRRDVPLQRGVVDRHARRPDHHQPVQSGPSGGDEVQAPSLARTRERHGRAPGPVPQAERGGPFQRHHRTSALEHRVLEPFERGGRQVAPGRERDVRIGDDQNQASPTVDPVGVLTDHGLGPVHGQSPDDAPVVQTTTSTRSTGGPGTSSSKTATTIRPVCHVITSRFATLVPTFGP